MHGDAIGAPRPKGAWSEDASVGRSMVCGSSATTLRWPNGDRSGERMAERGTAWTCVLFVIAACSAPATESGISTTQSGATVGAHRCPAGFNDETSMSAMTDCQDKGRGAVISGPNDPAAVCFNEAGVTYKCTAPESFSTMCAPNGLESVTIDKVTCQSSGKAVTVVHWGFDGQYIAFLPQTNDPDAYRARLGLSVALVEVGVWSARAGIALGYRSFSRQYLGPNGAPLETDPGRQVDVEILHSVSLLNFRFSKVPTGPLEFSFGAFALGPRFDPGTPTGSHVVWTPEWTIVGLRWFPLPHVYAMGSLISTYESPGQLTYTGFGDLAGENSSWYWQSGVGLGYEP
jgi:hypothetical protein